MPTTQEKQLSEYTSIDSTNEPTYINSSNQIFDATVSETLIKKSTTLATTNTTPIDHTQAPLHALNAAITEFTSKFKLSQDTQAQIQSATESAATQTDCNNRSFDDIAVDFFSKLFKNLREN